MSDRFPSTGAAAAQQGMVRIHRDSETRYVWPVHLAGWLSSGWRLGEERSGGTPTPTPAVAAKTAAGTNTPVRTPERSAPTDEPVNEPIEAHLPDNLLELEAEPAAANTPAAGSDAVSASFAEPPQPDPELTNTPGVELSDDSSEAPAVDPLADLLAESSLEPPAPPATARRGRPRKVRPEPEQQPAAEATSQQQAPAAVNTTEGDDPFGIDPLL